MFLKPTPNALLIFVDETGHHKLRDPNCPLFGYAGVAFYAQFAEAHYDEWRALKRYLFYTFGTPFHAKAQMSKLYKVDKTEMCHFFRLNYFSRFAALVTNQTQFPPELPISQVCLGFLGRILCDVIAPYSKADCVHIIFEDSKEGNKLVRKYFPKIIGANGERSIPVSVHFMSKSSREEGLEIADLVANTAARYVRYGLKKPNFEAEPLFDAIFKGVPKHMSYFRQVDSYEVVEKAK